MGKRGRKSTAVVSTDLKEVLLSIPQNNKSLKPYSVKFNGNTYYVAASSFTNAARKASVNLGLEIQEVSWREIKAAFERK